MDLCDAIVELQQINGGLFCLAYTHRGHRSQESREFRNARFFCFCNSKFDPEKQESVFVGKPEDLKIFVDATVPDAYAADIPDCPEGLVLTSNRGQGAFDL